MAVTAGSASSSIWTQLWSKIVFLEAESRAGCPAGSHWGGACSTPHHHPVPLPGWVAAEPCPLFSHRTKSVSSMSEFESLLDCSPYLPGKTVPGLGDHSRGKKSSAAPQLLPNGIRDSTSLPPPNCTYVNIEQPASDSLAKEKLGISSWDYSQASSLSGHDPTQKQMQRSYTAPDKTGIRIYYSPPVVRRLEAAVVHNKEGKIMIEPGFLFTMAKPKEPEESARAESTYSQWLCNFSKQQRELLDGSTGESTVPPVPRFPPSLHDLEISGNMSDDMKEITNCVRQAIRSSSLERKVKSTSSQTVGLAHVGTQTTQTVSVGLQTDLPRGSLHSKSWSPRSSSLVSVRGKQISTSLDKVHARIERPCCSPKYGSPKLQRRSSSKLDASKDRSLWNLHQGKQNGSAWARSTTTRDSPVLSNINDGLSSLFSVVEHAGSTESIWKPGCPEGGRAKAEAPKYGLVQEFFRNVCGRAQSPTAPPEKKDAGGGEEGSKKTEHPSLASYHPTESTSRILSKKVLKQSSCEDPKLMSPGQGSKEAFPRDPDFISAMASEVMRWGAPMCQAVCWGWLQPSLTALQCFFAGHGMRLQLTVPHLLLRPAVPLRRPPLALQVQAAPHRHPQGGGEARAAE